MNISQNQNNSCIIVDLQIQKRICFGVNLEADLEVALQPKSGHTESGAVETLEEVTWWSCFLML